MRSFHHASIACALSLAAIGSGIVACSGGPGAPGAPRSDEGGTSSADAQGIDSTAGAQSDGAVGPSEAGTGGDATATEAASDLDVGAPEASAMGAQAADGGGGGPLCGASCGQGQMTCAFDTAGPISGVVVPVINYCFPQSDAGCPAFPTAGSMPASCDAATCDAGACPPGLTNCQGNCVDTTADLGSCGACGHACTAMANGLAGCVDSTCAQGCPPGWTACGSTCSVTSADADNCGDCGHACATGEICTEGVCVAKASVWLVTGLTAPSEINADRGTVYWSDSTIHSIGGVAKTGGAVVAIAPSQSTPVTGLPFDSRYVYYWQGPTVMRAPKDGSAAPEMVTTASAAGIGLGVDSASVYFTAAAQPPTPVQPIQSAPKDGGAPTVYLTPSGPGIEPVAISDDHAMYILTQAVPIGQPPGTPATLLSYYFGGESGQPSVGAGDLAGGPLAVDAQNVYAIGALSEAPATGVVAIAKNGGGLGVAMVPAFTTYAGALCGVLWADSSGIHWTTTDPVPSAIFGNSFPAPRAPTSTQLIAPGVGPVANIVADGEYLYWTDTGSGAIGKLRLPCFGKCDDSTAGPCTSSSCQPGCTAPTSLECDGECFDPGRPGHCGGCAACPVPPTGAMQSTCTGDPPTCGVVCESGYHACGASGDCLPDGDRPSDVGDPCILSSQFGVFVSTAGSDSTGTGTPAAPYATISYALGHLAGTSRVYVCNGDYSDHVSLWGPTSLYGGLTCAGGNWAYVGGKATVTSPDGTPALTVDGYTSPIVQIEDMGFVSQDAVLDPSGSGNSLSSVAVLVNETAFVSFARSAFRAGNGADASQTKPPLYEIYTDGQVAPSGSPNSAGTGGAGGTPVCGALWSGPGGAGGTVAGAAATDGASNAMPSLGVSAGYDGRGGAANAPGHPGASGGPGVPATAAATFGSLSGTPWQPSVGESGGEGQPGQGGGGGGAATSPPAGGTGGGAGGCGGGGGSGGAGGGASIALAIILGTVTLDSGCTLSSGTGGNGQPGGDGEAGQGGGPPGEPAVVAGGQGGNGGGGAGGAGGTGGISVCIMYGTTNAPTSAGSCAPGAAGQPGTGGTGGAGGDNGDLNPGAPGPDGPVGLAGASASLWQVH